MARIPQYTQSVMLDRSQPSNVSADYEQAIAPVKQIESVEKAANAQMAQLAKEQEAEGLLAGQKLANAFNREATTKMNDWRLERQGNPTGFSKEADDWFSSRALEMEKEAEGQNVNLDHFRSAVDGMRTSYFAKNTDWESGTRIKNVFTGTEQAIDEMNATFALTNPSYQDLLDHQNKLRDYTNTIGSKVLGPDDQLKLVGKGIDGANRIFFEQKLQSDPQSVKRVLEYGQGGRDALIEYIMTDIEGGGRYVKDGDGYAKYGINSKANPDVDVKNLTPEAAREIYKQRYWDKRLDNYDPAFQAVAFDALVNHGKGKDTWKMIDEAEGNPLALIVARREEYARLAEANPEKYAGNIPGWDRRMKELTSYVQDLKGGGAEYIKNAGLVDPDVIREARGKVDGAISLKAKSEALAARKAQEADTFTQIKNEAALEASIYDNNRSLQERIIEVRNNDRLGNISNEYATEAIQYLNSLSEAKIKVPEEKKLAAFNELTDDLRGIRVTLGGTPDKLKEIEVNSETLKAYQNFQRKVIKKVAAGEITEGEAKAFTNDFSLAVATAIQENQSSGGVARLMPGVQDAYGYAFDRIDTMLKNEGREKDLKLKKELVLQFNRFLGDYKTTGSTSKDEQVLNKALKEARASLNAKNYSGTIDTESSPNMVVRRRQAVPPVGTMQGGYRFLGGDPSDKNNWSKL